MQLERSSLMLALGGGVVGDVTGFAAAAVAGCCRGASAHHPAGDGGCRHWRQNRREPSRWQELDRCLSPTKARDD